MSKAAKSKKPTPHQLNTPLTPEQRLMRGLEHLARIRDAMTAQMMSILAEVEELKGQTQLDIEVMMKDGGYTDEEIGTYVNFSALNDHKTFIKENAVGFEVVKTLLQVDADSRKIAMQEIWADPSITAADILMTASRLKRNKISFEEKVFEASQLAFQQAFSEANKNLEASFRQKASDLYEAMKSYARLHEYLGRNPDRYRRVTGSDRYSPFVAKLTNLKSKLATASEDLLNELNAIFPNSEEPIRIWPRLAPTSPIKVYLAQAHYSLRAMSRSEFDRWLPGDHTNYYSWSSFDAIKFLSGIPPRKDARLARWLHPSDVRKLNAIDLCAGAGSQALGIEAAGYYMHGLIDSDPDSIQTLRRNRERWNVIEWDITKSLTQERVSSWRGKSRRAANLDLVSGALPIAPWAYRGDGVGELFTSAKNIIAFLDPKAFFFQTDVGIKAVRHRNFRQNLIQYFQNLGYSTKIWRLAANEFGVPQSRTLYYLVGIKRRYADRLRPPQVDEPKLLGSAVWSTAFPDLSDFARYLVQKDLKEPFKDIDVDKAINDRTPQQIAYDRWALNWLGRYKTKLAPDIDKHRVQPTGRSAEAWSKAGFEPQRDTLPRKDDNYFASSTEGKRKPKLPLSAPILQCLQGMPADWQLEGDEASQLQQLCSMRPPVVSLAIARQIHQAITGQSIDLGDPEARKVTSGRDRYIPNFLVGFANHPDPMAYRAQMWANEQIERAQRDLLDLFDDDGDDD